VRRLNGDTTERPFRYRDKGTMATISRFHAIAVVGQLQLSGFVGWLAWLAVHLFALTGFKNRIAVLANWTIAFIGNSRPQRAITAQQVFGRQALETSAASAAVDARAAAVKAPAVTQKISEETRTQVRL